MQSFSGSHRLKSKADLLIQHEKGRNKQHRCYKIEKFRIAKKTMANNDNNMNGCSKQNVIKSEVI